MSNPLPDYIDFTDPDVVEGHCGDDRDCLARCSYGAYCCQFSGTTTRGAGATFPTFSTTPPLTLTTRTTTAAPAPAPTSSCFPSSARVQLRNGKSVTMSELQIGDHVLVGKEIFDLMFSVVCVCQCLCMGKVPM